MTVAAQGSLRPSSVIGVTCEWCAYCLDEALVIRDWSAMRQAGKAMEAEQAMTTHHDRAKALMGRDIG